MLDLRPGMNNGNKGLEGRPAGRRRVFVQTDTGCVLGLELDRRDNVRTVKRRLQIALNVPTEESSLTIGDLVLKNDQGGGLVEILGRSGCFVKTKQLVRDIVKAIKDDVEPIHAPSGLGGALYFRNNRGEPVAIVKPTEVDETGCREVAAYLLDYDHFANVPLTALVNITHSIFNINQGMNGNKKKPVSKIASFQQFISHDFDASEHGSSSFPVAAVHRIGILDIRILNTDRHTENLLVRKLDGVGTFGQVELIPIDHGLCLPESLEYTYYEWIHWKQASIPFSEEELEYIANLDPFEDCKMLRMELPKIREACLRVLVLCTIFLKEAAAWGLCLSQIGEMMTRGPNEEPSELEVICIEARRLVPEREIVKLEPVVADGSVSFVKLADMNEEEWVFFLEKFQERLCPAFVSGKTNAFCTNPSVN